MAARSRASGTEIGFHEAAIHVEGTSGDAGMINGARYGRWASLALGWTLAACTQSPDGSTDNAAPTISGSPATSVMQGAAYQFVPSASDADGDALIFGVDAKPAWADFDTKTGRLSGTPGASDVGVDRGIVVWVSDGHTQTTLPAFDLTVTGQPGPPNHAPTISGSPPTTVVAGVTYSFAPTANDADGDTLTFTIRNKPAWATFSATTGQLQGIPQGANVGTFADIGITVSDGQAAVSLAAFSIVVTAPTTNHAPAISGTPMTSVAAGQPYMFVPTASDADGDTLTFGISGLPAWAALDTATGRLSGTPPSGTTGNFANIVISVSDGKASASLPAFTITVTAPTTNHPPTISGTPSTSAPQGVQYSFQPTAADADGDPLTFTIANRPTWATFNTSTGRLQGTPGAVNAASYANIVISVSDGKASTGLPAFSITVPNTPPTISGSPPTTATVGTAYTFTPTASDVDAGTTLTFSIANKPSWATFSATTGQLQGTPASGNVGTFANVTISVSDGTASASLPAFSVVVTQPNRPPTISGTPPTAVMQGTAYSFQPTASDPDGDSLTFSIVNEPSWATFSTSTGRLQGTPGPGDVGTTSGIVISVTDGKAPAVSLPAFSVTVQAVATGSATLTWTPPTQNTDGSALTDLAGYKIYWGTTQGSYPNSVTLTNPGLTSYVVTDLVPGTYFFVATALNSAGTESAFSAPASKTIQ
jgi:hypothetical protein